MKTTNLLLFAIVIAILCSCKTMEDKAEINRKLDTIIIPAIFFKGAIAEDMMRFLEDASRAADPRGVGVSIELESNLRAKQLGGPPHNPFGGRVTLREALNACCKILYADYNIRDGVIVVESIKKKGTQQSSPLYR